MTRRRIITAVGIAPFWLALGACGTVPRPSAQHGNDEAALLARAQAYWAAVQAGDHVAAWSYESIALDPNWTLAAYLKRVGGIIYREVRVLGVESLTDQRATVKVHQRFDVPLARLVGQEATILDRWVRLQGAWYHDREAR